ncbi:hypothetical protein [Deinococcus ficus]|uniref:Uncharacterized protein n=1 Tax=Deinococcus ficus TaxID=317577 RepID=A0A221T3B8_9DEIO|nr:hypothetical protein [Deinococcus ficus]ASN83336.1 hypothetical protein DFI_19250 [Deinococcus ficus]
MTMPLPPRADDQGPDALALICQHEPAARHATLWFAPGVPMPTCGATREAQDRECVLARAAPEALEDGRIHYRDDHPIKEPR